MLTVNTAAGPLKVLNASPRFTQNIGEEGRFSFTLIDDSGTSTFYPREWISFEDDELGTLFSGYITGQPTAEVLYPSPKRKWMIQCIDESGILSWRTSKRRYANQFAGVILVDQVTRYGTDDGLHVAAALSWKEQLSEWQNATMSGTVATTNASSGNDGDGDLELALSGSRVMASSFGSAPGYGHGIKYSGTASSGYANAFAYHTIWNAVTTLTTSSSGADFLSYEVWISSDSPAIVCGMDFITTDGLSLRDSTAVDQHGRAAHPATDLSGLANDQWYVRTIKTPASLYGKTIQLFSVAFESEQQGQYTAYFRSISYWKWTGSAWDVTEILSNSTPLGSHSQLSNVGYSNVELTAVEVANKATTFTHLNAINLASAVLVRSSVFTAWTETIPDGCTASRETSIDGGASWQQVEPNGAIPGLEPGLDCTGILLSYRDILTLDKDPSASIALGAANVIVESAYAATKADVSAKYSTATEFSTGTLTNTKTVGSTTTRGLTLNGFQRNWDDADYSNQTLYGASSPGQSVINRQFDLGTAATSEARSRLDFAGQWADFIAEVDLSVVDAVVGSSVVYRCTGWQNNDNTFAYAIRVNSNQLEFGRGTNSAVGAGAFTSLATAAVSITSLTMHRLKLEISGSSHKFYLDGVLLINKTDSTYLSAGYLGFRLVNGAAIANHIAFDNFGVVSALSGTWQPPSISLTSAATYGESQVLWDEHSIPNGCSVSAQTSINGGSTWQSITNGGAIAGLVAGGSLSGISLLLKLTLTASNANSVPVLNGVSAWIEGQYTSSGTWTSDALSLTNVGRPASSLVAWNANEPTNTTLAVATSINNGVSWQPVSTSGDAISGIALNGAVWIDTFDD